MYLAEYTAPSAGDWDNPFVLRIDDQVRGWGLRVDDQVQGGGAARRRSGEGVGAAQRCAGTAGVGAVQRRAGTAHGNNEALHVAGVWAGLRAGPLACAARPRAPT